jgi:hypothetical protein
MRGEREGERIIAVHSSLLFSSFQTLALGRAERLEGAFIQ